jgi:hypothetical protein
MKLFSVVSCIQLAIQKAMYRTIWPTDREMLRDPLRCNSHLHDMAGMAKQDLYKLYGEMMTKRQAEAFDAAYAETILCRAYYGLDPQRETLSSAPRTFPALRKEP